MKKTYLQPRMVVHRVCPTTMLALSGNFKEGSTSHEGVYDDPIDGGDAWVKPFDDDGSFWE